MPAIRTGENTLRLSVGFRDKAADRAGARSIARVNINNRDACYFSLVSYKTIQLEESPVTKSLSVCPSDLLPRPDALQIFKDNGSLSAFGFSNNLFTDTVISIFLKTRLFFGNLFEMSFGGFSPNFLKRLSELSISFSNGVYLFARKGIAITGSNYIHDAFIYAKNTFWVKWCSIGKLYNDIKEKFIILKGKVCLSFNGFAFKTSVLSYYKGDFQSAINGIDACDRDSFKRQKSLVIDNSRIFLEFVKSFLFCNLTIRDFSNSSNYKLRGQFRKLVSGFSINKMVELYLIKSFSLKGSLGNMVASIIKDFHSFFKRLMLLWNSKKFCLYSKLHVYSLGHVLAFVKDYFKRREWRFLPALKNGVSTPEIL